MTTSYRQQRELVLISAQPDAMTQIDISILTTDYESLKFVVSKYGISIEKVIIGFIEKVVEQDPSMIKLLKDIKKKSLTNENYGKILKDMQLDYVKIPDGAISFDDKTIDDVKKCSDDEQAMDTIYDLLDANSPIEY